MAYATLLSMPMPKVLRRMPMPKGLRRVLGKPTFLRLLALWIGWLVLIGIVAGTAVWARYIWLRPKHQFGLDDLFTLASLALAFFAGVVALLAYRAATGMPDLKLGIMFYGQEDLPEYEMNYEMSSRRRDELKAWFDATNDYSVKPLKEDPDGWKKLRTFGLTMRVNIQPVIQRLSSASEEIPRQLWAFANRGKTRMLIYFGRPPI